MHSGPVFRFTAVLLVLLSLPPAFADTPVVTASAVVTCPATTANCPPSRQQAKQAAEAFQRGMKLSQQKREAEAFDAFQEATKLSPRNTEYLTAREIARQHLVYDHVQAGNTLLSNHEKTKAMAEFRTALELDPANDFALQRLQDTVADGLPQPSPTLRVLAQADQVQLAPQLETAEFHYRGDIRGLYQLIANAFGVQVSFDESVGPRTLHFDLQNADFFTAARLAGQASRTFWAPLSEKLFIVAADSPENHRHYDRMSMRTFYVSGATAPTDLNDVVSTLRGVFDVRYISIQPQNSTIVVRAPTETLEAATRFVTSLDAGPPQVMLDIQAYEINRTFMRALGMQLPLQFSMFNIPQAALLLLAQPNVQQLINQIIANGGINQANAGAIEALLAQLQSQQSNPLLGQSFATFGHGLTLFGVSIPPLTANFNYSNALATRLDHVTMRALQGKPSNFMVGERFPVLNATFSPLSNSGALTSVLQNGSFQTAFPSFSYEDLGLIVKTTPTLHAQGDVTLNVEMAIKALTGQNINGVPVISNREYKGTITVKDGEQAVVAGMISDSEQRMLSGLPGFSRIPGLGLATSTQNKQEQYEEILVVVTPHVLSAATHNAPEMYLSPGK